MPFNPWSGLRGLPAEVGVVAVTTLVRLTGTMVHALVLVRAFVAERVVVALAVRGGLDPTLRRPHDVAGGTRRVPPALLTPGSGLA